MMAVFGWCPALDLLGLMLGGSTSGGGKRELGTETSVWVDMCFPC